MQKGSSAAMMKFRAALEVLKHDLKEEYHETKGNRDFWLVASAAFGTYGTLAILYGPWSGWTLVGKVIAGGLATTIAMWWFLRPAYQWCCVRPPYYPYRTKGQQWLRDRKYDYIRRREDRQAAKLQRIRNKELKKQVKADAALRERLISRILKVNAMMPLPLNYCYEGAAGINPTGGAYQGATIEEIEKEVDNMMTERHGGVFGMDRYEKWEQALPPLK